MQLGFAAFSEAFFIGVTGNCERVTARYSQKNLVSNIICFIILYSVKNYIKNIIIYVDKVYYTSYNILK